MERPSRTGHWQIDFRISDVHAAAARITANGGKILNRPMEVSDRAASEDSSPFGGLRVT